MLTNKTVQWKIKYCDRREVTEFRGFYYHTDMEQKPDLSWCNLSDIQYLVETEVWDTPSIKYMDPVTVQSFPLCPTRNIYLVWARLYTLALYESFLCIRIFIFIHFLFDTLTWGLSILACIALVHHFHFVSISQSIFLFFFKMCVWIRCLFCVFIRLGALFGFAIINNAASIFSFLMHTCEHFFRVCTSREIAG